MSHQTARIAAVGCALCVVSWVAGCAIRIDWPLHEVEVVISPASSAPSARVARVVSRVEDLTLEPCEGAEPDAPTYERPVSLLGELVPSAWAHVTTSTLELPQEITVVGAGAHPVALGTIEPWMGSYCAATLLVRASEAPSAVFEVDGSMWHTEATGEVRIAFAEPVVFGEDEDLVGTLVVEVDEAMLTSSIGEATLGELEEEARARHMLGELGEVLSANLEVEAAR